MSQKMYDAIKPVKHAHGGVKAPHKKFTAEQATIKMPPPDKVYIAMQQHIGAPCLPTVKKGDKVFVGSVVGDSDKYVSAPIHSSVSGTVEGMTKIQLPSGVKTDAVIIASDGLMTPDPELKPHPVTTVDELLKAAHDSGLVGLGGAGFPTYIKLTPNKDKPIDTVIINAAECEPFITADYREAIENSESLMEGVFMLLDVLKPRQIIIAVEDNKPAAIEKLEKIAGDGRDKEHRVMIMKLRSHYPQGAEKVLVYTATGRKIPQGGLPADVGCIVMNITSVSKLYEYITTGMPLVSKRLTVDGAVLKKSAENVIVPIGTTVDEVIDFVGEPEREVTKVLMGGPMMGLCISDGQIPVLKQNNAIILFGANKDSTLRYKETACIRCGRCGEVCPMSLLPTAIEKYSRFKDIKALERAGVLTCMECGSCAFTCPAHRPLVQYMRLAKEIYKKGDN